MFDISVLGVDPGLASVGLAVVSRRGRKAELAWADTVRTSPGHSEAARLAAIAEAVRAAIQRSRPDAVAVERLAWNRNHVSALQVARATGAVMVEAARAGLAVEEYGPNEVKIAVTGSGDADKGRVRLALERLHGLQRVPMQPDAADAVAVAMTHILGSRLRAEARTGTR